MADIAHLSANKTIVITGANAGLGYSSVRSIALAGTADCIIMACRDLQKCKKARFTVLQDVLSIPKREEQKVTWKKHVTLYVLQLDLSSIVSIQNFVRNVQTTLIQHCTHPECVQNNVGTKNEQKARPIHILLNNAGIMGVHYSLANETGIEMQMQVNHIGHFALTSLLLPNLASATLSRVVSVSSLAGAMGPAFQLDDINFTKRGTWNQKNDRNSSRLESLQSAMQSFIAYAASKRANLLFTQGMNDKLFTLYNGTIQAVVAHPGYSRTSLVLTGWNFFPLWFRQLFASNHIGSMSSDVGAMCQLRAALDVSHVPSNAYVGPMLGVVGKPIVVGTSVRSWHHLFWPIRDLNEVSAFWDFSETVIGWNS